MAVTTRKAQPHMDVLSSRVLLHPTDPERSRRFYRDVLGLAVYREFGDPADPSLVFFLGGGLLEVSSAADRAATGNMSLWLQVRDLRAEHQRLVGLDVTVLRAPRTEPWGLREMWIGDPDGVRIVLVEVPEQHPIRRDTRGLAE
jgi:catechol 2,3-dioxygenase-like lactoylglutathione lyase family enzyme